MNPLKIGIFGQFYHDDADVYLRKLLEIISNNKATASIEKKFFKSLKKRLPTTDIILNYPVFEQLDQSFDVFFSIGGDGTMLKTISKIKDLGVPLAGINTGRLGFLASIPKDDMEESVVKILQGQFSSSKRSLLSVSVNPEIDKVSQLNFALNDVSILRKNTTSMIKIEASLNDEYLNTYWSDGLIISTPTGSTAYSLSCGGPIMFPTVNSFILTPIAPHNLNVRPIVIPDDTEIKLKITGRDKNYLLSLDSRVAVLPDASEIVLKKAPFEVNLIQLQEESFIKTLRKKLLWGEDTRN